MINNCQLAQTSFRRKNPDFVKIRTFLVWYFYSDLGAHVDGFIAVAAHSIVIGASQVSCFDCVKLNIKLCASNKMYKDNTEFTHRNISVF